jgi:hypothetical protein
MNAGRCLVCGQKLPIWSRSDRRTCNSACRTRLWRAGRSRGDACVTGTRLTRGRLAALADRWAKGGMAAAVAALARGRPEPKEGGREADR